MSDVEIRPTTPADLDALADVLVQVHASDGYPVEGVDDARAWVELPDALRQWTALLDGKPVGHVALLRPGPGDGAPELLDKTSHIPLTEVGVLARLFIAPAARGNSAATKLIDAVVSRAHELGLWLTLDVLEKDQAAIRLYEFLGWSRVGTLLHVFGADSKPAIAMMAPQRRDGQRGAPVPNVPADGGR